jgi:hypothetical protein
MNCVSTPIVPSVATKANASGIPPKFAAPAAHVMCAGRI